jgi:hypothetical protein
MPNVSPAIPNDEWTYASVADGTHAMWTDVAKGVEVAIDIDDTDFAVVYGHDFALARWQVI